MPFSLINLVKPETEVTKERTKVKETKEKTKVKVLKRKNTSKDRGKAKVKKTSTCHLRSHTAASGK